MRVRRVEREREREKMSQGKVIFKSIWKEYNEKKGKERGVCAKTCALCSHGNAMVKMDALHRTRCSLTQLHLRATRVWCV